MSNPEAGVRVITQYLDAMSVLDTTTAASLFSEDATLEFPFTPPGMPAELQGRSAIAQSFGGLAQFVAPMKFADYRITPTTEENDFIAEYTSDSTVLTTGLPYANRYITRVSVVDGKITYLAEYYNPIVLLVALGASVSMPQ